MGKEKETKAHKERMKKVAFERKKQLELEHFCNWASNKKGCYECPFMPKSESTIGKCFFGIERGVDNG